MSLLATYEQFGKFYMMFPWAQADLQEYWARHSAPSLDQEAINWLAEQCSGIAEGLAQIHHYETTDIKRRTTAEGIEAHLALTNKYDLERMQLRQRLFDRHGDIKPENILWFKNANKQNDRGVLKISDFGLAEFSARHSQCYKRNSQMAHSPSYRPPECDLEGATVGQSYDIWTLGCLYLELITWQLGGLALLQAFRKARSTHDPMRHKPTATFFEIVRCERTQTVGAMVKPEVVEVCGPHSSLRQFAHVKRLTLVTSSSSLNCTLIGLAQIIFTTSSTLSGMRCWSSSRRTRRKRAGRVSSTYARSFA